jgi:hypothetical protein
LPLLSSLSALVYVAPPPFFFSSVPLLQLSLTYYKLPKSCTSVNISPMPRLGEWDVGKSPTQTHIHGSRSLNTPPPPTSSVQCISTQSIHSGGSNCWFCEFYQYQHFLMWEIWYGLVILDVSTLRLILGGSAIAT